MQNLFSFLYYLSLLFSIWMGIDCIRRKDNVFIWLFAIFVFHPFGGIYYFFKIRNLNITLPRFPGITDLPQTRSPVGESGELKHLKEQTRLIGGPYQFEQLGFYYLKQQNMDSAQKSFSKAVEKNPDLLSSKYGLSKTLFALNRYKEAADTLEEIIKENQNYDYGHALFGLAEAYRMAKDDEKALVTYERVYRLSSFFKASVYYGELLEKKGRLKEAIKVMSSVIVRGQDLPEYKYEKEIFWIKKAERFVTKNSK